MLMRNDRVLGAIGSMVVWVVYFVAVYSLQGLGCVEGWHEVSIGPVNQLTVVMVLLTLVALALIAWNGWRGWQGWRAGATATRQASEFPERRRFLGALMLWLAALSLVATVFVAVPIIMLPPCAA